MSSMSFCIGLDPSVLAECVLLKTSKYSALESSDTKVSAKSCVLADSYDSAAYASEGGSLRLEKCTFRNNTFDIHSTNGSFVYSDAIESHKAGCRDCDNATVTGSISPLAYAPEGSYPTAQDPIFVERQQVR
jgi:hypothetical protein